MSNPDPKPVGVRPVVLYTAVLLGLALLIYISWPSSVQPGIRVGDRVPSFALPSQQGETVRLEDFSGTPIVLRFSSRHCSFCGDDFALLASLQEAGQGSFRIVAIETGSQAQDVLNVLQGREMPFPILLDTDGSVAGNYQIQGLPMYYWIDADGILRASFWGVPERGEWQLDILTKQGD